MIEENTAGAAHWSAASASATSSNKPSSHPTSDAWRWRRPETPLTRFLGGTPANVALRLLLLSMVVGALMMWLDIKPNDILEMVEGFARRVWAMGFDAIRELGNYLLAGAVIVVPVWFVLRLLDLRRPR